MNDIMNQANQMAQDGLLALQNTVVLAVTVCIGVLIGLLGRKLVRVWAAVMGLILGTAAGGAVSAIAGFTGMTSVGVMAAGAVILAVLFGIFYKVGMFFFIWMAVFITGTAVIGGERVIPVMLVCGVLGLLLAIFTMKFFDVLVIILTSIYGGFLAGNAVVSLVGLKDSLGAMIAVPVGAAVLCALVQFILHSGKVKKEQARMVEEHRENESRENEIQQARMILDGTGSPEEEEIAGFQEPGEDESRGEEEEAAEEIPVILDEEIDLEEDEDFRIIE